jgi:hypothetical protein
MADKKISALTAATTPLAGTEVLPIVQSGATVKVAVSDLTAGRSVAASRVIAGTSDSTVGTLEAATTSSGATTRNIMVQNTSANLNAGVRIDFMASGNTNRVAYIKGVNVSGGGGATDLIFATNNDFAAPVDALKVDSVGNVTALTGNVVQGTAGKGVTTGSATALGFGTNGSTTQATLATNGTWTAGNMQSNVQTKTVASGGTQNLFYVNNYALQASGFMTIRSSGTGITLSTYIFNIMGNGIATGVTQLATEVYGGGGSSFTVTETRNSPGAPNNQVALVNTAGVSVDIIVTYQFITGYENVTFI